MKPRKNIYYLILITIFATTITATIASCEIRAKRAQPLIETCQERFGDDHDKKNWCLGKCEKVSNAENRAICESVKAKK